MRRLVVPVSAVAALICATTAAAAFQPIRRTFGETTVPRVRAGVVQIPTAHARGRVRVIATLPLPPLAARTDGRSLFSAASRLRLDVGTRASAAYLARLSAAQSAAVAQLRRAVPEARVDHRYRIVLDGLSLTLPAKQLPRLARLGFVQKIFPSIRYAATLNQSPSLIGATEFENSTGLHGDGVKIAVVDTGVDPTNPFLDAGGYSYPPGFPKGDRRSTTPKVIVARTFPGPGSGRPGRKALDPVEFHGTHVAGIAAGDAGTDAPAGPGHPAVANLAGVAPRAYVGNYRVFTVPTPIGHVANTPEIIAAFEAAVADGMDVINFSGGGPQTDPANDALVEAVRNVSAAGVVPVIAAGNDRDDFGLGSVGSPGTAPDAISVAAVSNTHVFAEALSVPGGAPGLQRIPFAGAAGQDAPPAWGSINQTLVDAGSIVGRDGKPVDRYLCGPARDPNGLATTLPAHSLDRMVVLASRGFCTFATKAFHAKLAGAAGMIVVDNRSGEPNPIPARLLLPAGTVSDLDGQQLRAAMSSGSGRLPFRVTTAVEEITDGRGGVITSFSSGGPTAFGHALKPDVSAPGGQILSSTPPKATGSTFTVLDGTSMATPHVAGAAALLLEEHPDWTARQVKSALVSTAGPAWADTARTTEAPVLLEGGGLVDLRRAGDPQLFTDPVSLSFADLNVNRGAATKALLLAVVDAGQGGGTWEVEVRPQAATPGASLDVPGTVTVAPGGQTFLPVAARAAADAPAGDDYGFLVLKRGSVERRVPYVFAVTRPQLQLGPAPVKLKKLQFGDTRVGVSRAGVYRFPAFPFGPPPAYTGPGMDENGAEKVYVARVDRPVANIGVSILAATPGSVVDPWLLGSLDENDVQGYAGTPVNVNDLTFDAHIDIGAAAAVFPRQQTFYVSVDSGRDPFTGASLGGQYVLNSWVNDVTPPFVQLLTRRVAAGRPLLVGRVLDRGAGVDPLSLVIAYKRVLVGASAYDPISGFVLFGLPQEAPRLTPGQTRSIVIASDYQEAKNVNTVGADIMPNTAFRSTTIRVVNGPAVTWLSPEPRQCVPKSGRLLVSASGTKAIRQVRFLADGRRVGVDRAGPGGLFGTSWKTAGLKSGRHTLVAVAVDAAGRMASSARAVRLCR